MTPYIHALETGLSSDPPMNWRLSALDGYTAGLQFGRAFARQAGAGGQPVRHGAVAIPPSPEALRDPWTGLSGDAWSFSRRRENTTTTAIGTARSASRPAETVAAGWRLPGVRRQDHRGRAAPGGGAGRPAGGLPSRRVASAFESLIPLPEVIAASTGLQRRPAARPAPNMKRCCERLGTRVCIFSGKRPWRRSSRRRDRCVAEGIRRLRSGKVEADSRLRRGIRPGARS